MRANRRDGSDRAGQDYPILAEPGRNRLTVVTVAFGPNRGGPTELHDSIDVGDLPPVLGRVDVRIITGF
jgi:hypothetical protein